MTDVFLPLSADVASVRLRYIDSTGMSRNPYNGAARTASRGGDRVSAAFQFTASGGASVTGKRNRRRLLASLMGLRGRQCRLVLTDPSYTPAGSFPAAELLANNDFSDGTTGWTADAGTLTVSDGVARLRPTSVGSGSDFYRAASLTAYKPHVLRSFLRTSPGMDAISIGRLIQDGTLNNSDLSTSRGMGAVAFVPASASSAAQYPAILTAASGFTVGEYIECLWSSLSQCILADGAANLAPRSDQFDNATWTKFQVTVTANSVAAPDGTATADTLNEDATAASTHAIYQTPIAISATAADYSYSCSVKAGTRSWVMLYLQENTGNHGAYAYFNVSTGVAGTASQTGANWANVRSHIASQGNGWYRVTVTARKVNAATALAPHIYIAEGDTDSQFSGLSAASLYIWRASLAQSSNPSRGSQTTSAAVAASAQTGSGINVKGLPESTSGLLLAGDWVEIRTSLGSQLAMLVESLDSDASGCGTMQVSPAIRGTVADNAYIAPHKPMGRFILTADAIEYLTEPGIISTAMLDLEESPF